MTDPTTLCRTCVTPIGYVDCPTGGWWAHETHPADEHDAVPGAWVDGDELMEEIAAEVWEHCAGEGTSLVVDDPRNIAGTAAAVARRMRAVPSAPADRAAVLREAIKVAEDEARHLYDDMGQKAAKGARLVADRLRRMVDEAEREEPVRCPLCADARVLDTPAEAREHFTTVHPEERLVGSGPWPLLANRADEAQQQQPRRVKVRVVAVTKSPALLDTPDDEIAALCADEAQQPCDGCGHPGHPARECMVTSYGERCACDEPVTGEAQQPEAQAIDDYLRFLRGQGPEPDLSKLPPQQREAVAGQFEIVRALADRDGELPPIDRDPVARRLGLHGPADEAQQQADTKTRPHCPHCQLPHDLEPGSLPVAACESIRARIAEAGHRHAEDDHGGCAAVDCEVALLRLTLDAVEEGRRELRSDNARLRSQLWTLTAIFEGFARLLATSSRDWGQYAPDAWLCAVICGWDCEEPVHDETCTHGAMEEMQQRHGWDDETVAKARRYRAAVRAVVESGKEA